ncbi:coenzyme F420-0:L-glutamate ligase [Arcanobacterium ihumii]|uniref:coenzyme F420-0:L-glutamate ligase n=1 Tax=Arcanobacterium ihumii TaxID=2138162 RepID=UPI001358C462|nr:coenzyme F420-0:L-glutamate ligase [Arcanobacterium ihumii]
MNMPHENNAPELASVICQAVPNIPMVASGDDLAAVVAAPIARVRWENGTCGMRGTDIVVISSKLVAKAQGRWFRFGERPSGFVSRSGIPAGLDLDPVIEGDAEAAKIRRGLTARFGGRPGVIISSDGVGIGVAGMDHTTSDGLTIIAQLLALHRRETGGKEMFPLSLIRGVVDVLTWEDCP